MENQIRKKWLVAFIISCITNYICWAVDYGSRFWDNCTTGDWVLYSLFVAPIILTGIPAWIMYHCAYKKRGSYYLLVVLILSPLKILSDVIKIPSNEIVSGWPIYLVVISIYAYYWINCYRLYQLNDGKISAPSIN